MWETPVWFKCDHNCKDMQRKKNHLTARGFGRIDAPTQFGSSWSRIFCRQTQTITVTSASARAGDMKQNIIKRIHPSARVLHKAKPQRKHFESVWNCGKGTRGELNMGRAVERSCGRKTFQGLQALFSPSWTRDTTRTALRFVDAQKLGETWRRRTRNSECSRHKSTCARQAYGSNNGVTQ